jgi:uncharacterized protein (TIGR03437 family)
MVIDSTGTMYAITLSGLTVAPTVPATDANRPQITRVVNSSDGSTNIQPGSFITITGASLASAATANAVPAPTVLGGSCVTFNSTTLPLLQTSGGQILAQIPQEVSTGTNVVEVRSLALAQASDPMMVTVQRLPATN